VRWFKTGAGSGAVVLAFLLALGSPVAHAAVSDPSGVKMPVGNLNGWRQVFDDDFITNVALGKFPGAESTRWWIYPAGWHDTTGHGTYEPKIVSTGNGEMVITLHTEANGTIDVAAPVPLLSDRTADYGQKYGMYSIRFRADQVAGFKTAWLLWPDSGVWPRDGELDFPEGSLNGTIGGYVHNQGGTSGNSQEGFSTAARYSAWHTATIVWAPRSVTYLLDGKVVGHVTGSKVPDTPMHWVIQTETDTSGVIPAKSAVAHVYIDWAVAYAYSPGTKESA
jgi:hypothetical protein